MLRLKLVMLLAAMLWATFASQDALAQRRWPRRPTGYQPPAGPTLSPYLELSRPPTGVYNNYYQFVRPSIRTRATFREHHQELSELNREVRDVQREVGTLSQVREAGVAPTGIGSVYMNYSHYFSSPNRP